MVSVFGARHGVVDHSPLSFRASTQEIPASAGAKRRETKKGARALVGSHLLEFHRDRNVASLALAFGLRRKTHSGSSVSFGHALYAWKRGDP